MIEIETHVSPFYSFSLEHLDVIGDHRFLRYIHHPFTNRLHEFRRTIYFWTNKCTKNVQSSEKIDSIKINNLFKNIQKISIFNIFVIVILFTKSCHRQAYANM